jgi:hypothetical protein
MLLQLPVSHQATSSAARACSVVLLARIGTAVAGLIIVAIVTGIGLTLLALVGDVLVDWMWFSAIGYAQVFWTTIGAKAGVFAVTASSCGRTHGLRSGLPCGGARFRPDSTRSSRAPHCRPIRSKSSATGYPGRGS